METVANTAHLPPLDDPHEREAVAERAVTLGFVPDGQAAAVSEGSRVEPVPVRRTW